MVLLKLVLLERKILVYSRQESIVSAFILSLCSLVPGLLAFGGTHLNSKKIEDYLKCQEMYGLPLQVYNSKTYLMPLFTLNDLNLLKELNGYTIGTTNKLLLELPQIKADVYINIDEQSFILHNKALEPILKLTTYEQTFIGSIVKSIESEMGKKYEVSNWSHIETNMDSERFSGSNDFVRGEFAKYFHKFMVDLSIAEYIYGDYEPTKVEENVEIQISKLKQMYDRLHMSNKKDAIPITEEVKSVKSNVGEKKQEIPKDKKEYTINQILQNYNIKFLKEWQFAINYRLWQLFHSSKLFALSNFIDDPIMTTIYYENGDIYIGEVLHGKRVNTGTLIFDEGNSIYEGKWENDKRNGKGKQSSKEGTYSGTFME